MLSAVGLKDPMVVPKIDRDSFNSVPIRNVTAASMTVLDRLQNFTPEVQVLASAAVFLTLCENLGTPAQEAFTTVKNVINGAEGKRSEFLALDAYVKGEIL